MSALVEVPGDVLAALTMLANTMKDDYEFWREDGVYPQMDAAFELTEAIRADGERAYRENEAALAGENEAIHV